MSKVKRFLDAMSGQRRQRIEESPFNSPGLFENDARVILESIYAGKWGGVEFYGPGAADAASRRAAKVNPAEKIENKSEEKQRPDPRRKKKSTIQALEKKVARLQSEIKDLENGKR